MNLVAVKKVLDNKWNVLLGLVVLAFILYWRTLFVGFISDDYGFVEDAELRGWSAFNNNFGDKFFIPVSHFFGLILFKLTAGDTVLMHGVQILIHAVVSFQLYLFIKEVGVRLQKESQFIRIALFAGFIFLIHPYQTEAVVWLASKSYGYSLLFSILSVRWFFKDKIYWSVFFLLIAIHTKESGYFIPLTTVVIAWGMSYKVERKYWLSWGMIILGSLLLRYLALGELVGGYGAEVHTKSQMLLFTIPFYFLKFLTIFKLSESYTIVALSLFLISLISIFIAFYSKKLKLKGFYWFIILVGSLLIPVLNLEITSVGVIASDRYSYFALVAIAFGAGYMLTLAASVVSKVLFASVFVLMIVVTWNNNSIWVESGLVKDQFLKELTSKVAEGDNILLVNIPDTYRGVYCLRNGIEDYLRTQGVTCNIEIDNYQQFKTQNWGCYLYSVENKDVRAVMSFPDSLRLGRAFFDNENLIRFDKVLIYRNREMHLVKE